MSKSKNTIGFIRKGEVPRGFKVTYGCFVCDYCPLKSEPFKVRLTVGGEILEYQKDESSPASSLLESKLILNSTISDACRVARFMSCDMKFFFKLFCQEQNI